MQKTVIRLTVLMVFLTPLARSAEIAIIILAICGLVIVKEQYSDFVNNTNIRLFSLLFLLLWLPIFFSAFDADRPTMVIRLFGEYLRFFFFGILLILYLEKSSAIKKVQQFVTIILLFWIVDALIQAVVGVDLLGFPIIPGRLNGLFGRHLKLGHFLAIYSPIMMVYVSRWKQWYYRAACWVGLSLVILLSGSRGAWVMFAIACFGYWGYLWLRDRKINLKFVLTAIVLLFVMIMIGYGCISSFRQRLDKTMLVFKGDRASINEAVSIRLPIWGVALRMIEEHPFNGIGAGRFRYIYNEYALEGDPFAKLDGDGTGASHAHSMILDIGSETGGLGLLGVTSFSVVLLVVWMRARREQKLRAAPFAIGLLAYLFPLNSNFAFYSGAWTQVLFWYTALFVISVSDQVRDPDLQEGCATDAGKVILT